MTDEQSTPSGQAPEPTTPAQAAGTDDSAPTTDAPDAQVDKLRKEAAKWRTQLREAQAQIEELSPLAEQYREQQEAQKTEAEKAQALIADLQRQMAEKDAAVAQAAAEAQLLRMATKAGVDPDVAAMLDMSKLDLENEDATVETLKKFAPQARVSSTANPERGAGGVDKETELRDWYHKRGTSISAFGN